MSDPNEKAAEDLFPPKAAKTVSETKIQTDSDETDFAFAYAEYDKFSYIAAKVIRFKDKTIEEWLEEVAIPQVDSTMSLDEMERLNLMAINLIEKVNRNYGLAKSAFDLASIKYTAAYQKEKITLMEEAKKAKIKMPSADALDTAVQHNIQDTYLAHKIAELFYEFWKSVQTKVKSFDGRLTSLSMLQNMERRNTKYE